MTDNILELLPKRTFDFGTLAVGTSQSIIVTDRVNVVEWREMTLLVDVHTHSLASGSGFVNVFAYTQSWTAEEPGLDFSAASAQVIVDNTVPSPAFLVLPINSLTMGPMMKLVVVGNRSAGGSLTITLSVRLSRKNV